MPPAAAPAVAPHDPRLKPNFDLTRSTFRRPRLDQDRVAEYCRNGFLTYHEPVLREPQFVGLTERFEHLLDRHTAEGKRPEAMDTPHFGDHKLFEWIFSDEVLDLVEPLIGPNIALFSTHFICKPAGHGRRVPWHEDSFYWRGRIKPMHVCTVWLAIDPSLVENGCMNVIPRALHGYSNYDEVSEETNVFPAEINWLKNLNADRVGEATDAPENVVLRAHHCQLRPNEASLHDARLIHGSDANTSPMRRCGYTMRFIPAAIPFDESKNKAPHQIYLARGEGHPDNTYADPTRDYDELFRQRIATGNGH